MTKAPLPGKRGVARNVRAPHVELQVTQEIIDRSCRRNSSHCVIAEAVKAAVPGARFVAVDLQTVRFTDPTQPYRYVFLTPRSGQLALVGFDQGEVPQPFRMRLTGGSVIRAGTPKPTAERRRRERQGKRQEEGDDLSAKRLVPPARASGKSIPDVIGGKHPPRAVLGTGGRVSGRRREFGIRSLER